MFTIYQLVQDFVTIHGKDITHLSGNEHAELSLCVNGHREREREHADCKILQYTLLSNMAKKSIIYRWSFFQTSVYRSNPATLASASDRKHHASSEPERAIEPGHKKLHQKKKAKKCFESESWWYLRLDSSSMHHINIYIYTYVCVCVYIYICVCMYIYIYIYISISI